MPISMLASVVALVAPSPIPAVALASTGHRPWHQTRALLPADACSRGMARSVPAERRGSPSMMAEVPGTPKEVATAMSVAVQAALRDGKRQLQISLPAGLGFGLFGAPPGKQLLGNPDAQASDGVWQRMRRARVRGTLRSKR